jgi:hypothetical protein
MGTSEKTIDRVIFESDGTFKELAAPPTNPPADYARLYRGTDGKWYSVDSTGLVSPLGSGGSITPVEQTAHGFLATEIGAPLRMSGGNWVKAQANMANTAEAFVLLYRVIDVNNIEVISGGEVSGLDEDVFEEGVLPAVDSLLWLSAAANGKLTITKPNVWGYITKPLGVVTGSGKIIFANMRADVAGNSNAQFTVALSNNAMTQAVYVGDMQGGTIKGDIVVAATTPLSGHYEIKFSKNGAGVYKADVSQRGDLSATDVTMADNGWLQITLGNSAGFTSGRFNYSINAPSAGASLVGTISESKLVPDGGSIGQFALYTAHGAAIVLTPTSPRKTFINGTTAPVPITLPTGTDVKAGYDLRVEVEGATEANPVTLVATTTVETIGGSGFAYIVALQDNPTLAAHWRILESREAITITNGVVTGGGTGAVANLVAQRNSFGVVSSLRSSITIRGTISSGTGSPTADMTYSALPTRFYPPQAVNNTSTFDTASNRVVFSNITTAGVVNIYNREFTTAINNVNFAVSSGFPYLVTYSK